MKHALILLCLAALGHCASITLDVGDPLKDLSAIGQLVKGRKGRDARFVRDRSVIANQQSDARTGFGGTAIARGQATAVNRGGGSAIANQHSSAVSRGPGVAIADGSSSAVSGGGIRAFNRQTRSLGNSTQPKVEVKEEPKANKTSSDLPKSRALDAPLKTNKTARALETQLKPNKTMETSSASNKTRAAESAPLNANKTATDLPKPKARALEEPSKLNKTSAAALKTLPASPKARAIEGPLKTNSTKIREGRRFRGGSAIANQESIAHAGPFGNADARGSANAQNFGFGSAIANQKSVATAGFGSSASASGRASAGSRFRRSPLRDRPVEGKRGRPTIVSQHSDARTGADGTAIAHGTASGQGSRGGATIVNQSSRASGGDGAVVIADGSATGTQGGRGKRASGDPINDLVTKAVSQAVKTASSDPNAVILSSSTKIDSTGSGQPTKTTSSFVSI